ncbi:hypothetical protein BRADI_1g58754v3 [Brachypodium distachyon]|uniref:Uncharacterized protein n=1 Tax=Brachypodium distachyon TaxID=15368 RepID=A0A2K2DSC3_BRADI|nr:hypothetical protein BRADI_1g58754v3 [Brachypodium distachyon]
MVGLKSRRVRKVVDHGAGVCPFVSFPIPAPAREAASTGQLGQ